MICNSLTRTCVQLEVITVHHVMILATRYLIFNFVLAKLYINTLMSSLNSRAGWSSDDHSSHLSGIGNVRFGTRLRPQVLVHVESHAMQDGIGSKQDTTRTPFGFEEESKPKTSTNESDSAIALTARPWDVDLKH